MFLTATRLVDDEDICNLEMWVCTCCYREGIYAQKDFIIIITAGEKEMAAAGILPARNTPRDCDQQKRWLFVGGWMDLLVFIWYGRIVWSIQVFRVEFVLLFGVGVPHNEKVRARKKRYVRLKVASGRMACVGLWYMVFGLNDGMRSCDLHEGVIVIPCARRRCAFLPQENVTLRGRKNLLYFWKGDELRMI